MKSTMRVKTALFAAGLTLIAGSFFIPNTASRTFAGPPLVITETVTIVPPTTVVPPTQTAIVPPPPPAVFGDPFVVKTCPMNPAKPGEDLEFTITVGNRGNTDAVNVQVRDTLPPQLALKSVTATRGQVVVNGNAFIVDIGTVGVSETITIKVIASVNADAAAGAYTNVATLNTTSGGDNPNNNISLCSGTIGEIVNPPTGNDTNALPIAMLSMGALLLAASLLVRNRRTA
jgi:uncharacterized repeat protein (TIGR01451 family)